MVVAILFLISFLFIRYNIKRVNHVKRTVITYLVMFIGFILRGIGASKVDDKNYNFIIYLTFLGIRNFLIFLFVPVTNDNSNR